MTAGLLVAAVVVIVLLVFVLTLFPPRHARRWRHVTRPLRRKLRPRHYRT